MNTIQVARSSSVQEALARFQQELGGWITDATTRYANAPATDIHDQATYTTGWEPYIRATNDPETLLFLKALRDKIQQHFVRAGQWRHGYWTMQEAHHGTEHYELFLGMLWRLDPHDDATVAQIVDVAEHMGNWSSAVAPWFDWDRGLYHSFLFGADGIQMVDGADLNVPDHLRCINIALLAHRATNEPRYLDLATVHGARWVDAILADEELPIGLLPDRIVYRFDPAEEAIYRARVGQSSMLLTAIDRAESFLASDALNTFLYLWQATGMERFRAAAERLLDILLPTLVDPDAAVVADAVRHYRVWTNDQRYDAAVCAAVSPGGVEPLLVEKVQQLGFDPAARPATRPSGVGKRADMLLWLEDGSPRRLNPVTLGVAAEIAGDARLATDALDLAGAYLHLARTTLPDGRDHGCAARTISAVARGHGRENHAGLATALLGPLYHTFSQWVPTKGVN